MIIKTEPAHMTHSSCMFTFVIRSWSLSSIVNHFKIFEEKYKGISLYAFLLQEEGGIANKYIKTAKYYIDLYSKILGPYPYLKFALVENQQQTGYGMPSFTLMGSRIIRFPFILHSSYPHEILHNWWGNGVFADPEEGNWSEGLTAYLADHFLLELEGKGSQYLSLIHI